VSWGCEIQAWLTGLRVGNFISGYGDGSTYAHHMKDVRFTIPAPALLSKVVDLIDKVPIDDRDTKGDLYESIVRTDL
jgi:hypothetical protein